MTEDFDGCHRACRVKAAHSLIWGGCEHAAPPEPTVSMSMIYTDPEDGYLSIGFDTYTVAELGELITAGLRASDLPVNGDDLVDIGLVAARAIVHRNDKPEPNNPRTTLDNPATSNDPHIYLSTGCYHGDHAYCQAMTGLNGAKRPASCKKCGAHCICDCHQQTEPPVHIGNGANAEDCPACKGTNPPYPFICPGPDETAADGPDDLTGAWTPDPPIGCLTVTTERTPSQRPGLRTDIARAIHRYDNRHGLSGNDLPSKHHRGEADAVLTLLYREWPWLRAVAEDATPPPAT